MVKIPEQEDPTLAAMKAIIAEKENSKPRRSYLGASLIGNPCPRQIWYTYKDYKPEPHSARTAMRFEDGHRTEDLTAERLRLVPGIELWTHDENGNQFGFSAFDGKFKGHCDGIINGLLQAPKTTHIWEAKSCEEKKYNEFHKAKTKYGEKQALKNWNENYYIQAQLYMHYMKLDRHYTTVALAGGRDYNSCRTEYNDATALWAIERAEKIINAKAPPARINEKPDFYICRWCEFKDICRS